MKRLMMVVLMMCSAWCMALGEGTVVVEELLDNVERDSTDWRSMVELAHYYRERSNSMRTLQWTERAYGVHASDTLKRELATCYYQRADYERCLGLCRELLTPREDVPVPDSSEVYLMARCFEKMERVDSALVYMIMEADRNIENQSNLVTLAKALTGNGMAKVAMGYLERYCEQDSTNVAVNNVKALTYYNAGYPRKAIVEYNKLMYRYGDRRPSTLYWVGMSYLQLNDKDAALMYLEKANEKYQRTNGLALAMLGMVELDYDTLAAKGEADIYEAIELMQPDGNLMFRIYFSLGDYYAQKNAKEAVDYFLKAEKYKPGSADVCYQIGYCYYMAGKEDKEYEYWSRYLQLVEEEEESFVTKGVRTRVEKLKEERFFRGIE